MPIKRSTSNGKPCWKYGDAGICYLFKKGNKQSELKAKKKAIKQGLAIAYRNKIKPNL